MSDSTDAAQPHEGAKVPPVPLTVEGWSVLHQIYRIRWSDWNGLTPAQRDTATREAQTVLVEMATSPDGPTGLFSLLGHKGDLMLLHFRRTFDRLNAAELRLAGLKIGRFLELTNSYVSIVELGLYSLTAQLYRSLGERGVQPGTPEWKGAVDAQLEQVRESMGARLWPEIPRRRYVCFYPMDKKRGAQQNWYTVPLEERQRMMQDHGFIGRGYAGEVTQIISGSIGFDDWEWGVDLFADDPVVFKKLVYEMRFDEASALYALFGSFFLGLQFPPTELQTLLEGRTPDFEP